MDGVCSWAPPRVKCTNTSLAKSSMAVPKWRITRIIGCAAVAQLSPLLTDFIVPKFRIYSDGHNHPQNPYRSIEKIVENNRYLVSVPLPYSFVLLFVSFSYNVCNCLRSLSLVYDKWHHKITEHLLTISFCKCLSSSSYALFLPSLSTHSLCWVIFLSPN